MMRYRVLIIIVLCFLSMVRPLAAQADSSAVWQGDIKGVKTWITVVPRGHNIDPTIKEKRPWWEWGNTTTDAYIFAFDDPRNVRIILAFEQQPSGLPEAKLYVNRRGRLPVDFSLQGSELRVLTNDGHPYITVRPKDGGWLSHGLTNYNLDVDIDGTPTLFGDDQAPTDGIIDVETRVRSDVSGVPKSQITRLMNDSHPKYGYIRFGATERMPDAPPFKVAPPLIPGFPYFDIGNGRVRSASETQNKNEIDWFRENPNPLYFNALGGELLTFSFVGFQENGVYYVNSVNAPPAIDFESPFAFYGFGTASRYPQLVIRAASFPAEDMFGPATSGASNTTRTSFRYSWKTSDETLWAYSLQVAGNAPYDRGVTIGDSTFSGVPASELPTWVTSKPWSTVTFVEAIDGYSSSEGIYFYSTQSDQIWPWLTGQEDQSPKLFAQPYLPNTTMLTRTSDLSLPINFRGEYNTAYDRQPQLYMSSIDHRVHLLHAQAGIWNLGGGQVLRTYNFQNSDYTNVWVRERIPAQEMQAAAPKAAPGNIEEALYILDGYTLYTGARGAELRQGSPALSAFEISPPKDKASWQAFREQVDAYQAQKRDTADLHSWLAAFPGKPVLTSSGAITDVRATVGGFRFVVDLSSGSSIDLPGVPQSLAPGTYVVTYNGSFTAVPLTPAKLSLQLTLHADPNSDTVGVRADVTNGGLQDANGLIAIASVAEDEQDQEIGRTPLDVLAGQPAKYTFNVQPRLLRGNTIRVRLEDTSGHSLVEHSAALPPARPNASWNQVLGISSVADQRAPIAACLVLAAVLTGAALWLTHSRRRSEAV